MKAIRVHKYGGPDVLQLEEIDIPEPGRGEARGMLKAARGLGRRASAQLQRDLPGPHR